MKRKLKSYQAFTRAGYRLFVCLIPVMAVATGCLADGSNEMIQLAVAVNEVLFLEIMADFWVFGGLASAETGLPEYLKTSRRGIRLLKDAAEVQFVRVFLGHLMSVAAYVVVWRLPSHAADGAQLVISATGMAVLGFFCTALGIFVGRYFTTLFAQMLVASLAAMLFGLLLVCLTFPVWLQTLLLLVGVAVVWKITIGTVKKMGKENYYDKAD